MACRLKNIIPVCEYNVDGIDEIKLLDFADFQAFAFQDDGLYDAGTVTGIYASGDLVKFPAGDGSKYTGDSKGGLNVHTLETFVPGLTGETLAALNLADKRRQIPIFKTRAGRWYTFGSEAGAVVTYTSQTAEIVGSLVTFQAASIYPLFEVTAAAAASVLSGAGEYRAEDYDTINDYK